MANNVIQYDLLISCPGDIKTEIDVIDKVVDQFNQQYSDTLGISIRTRHWLKSSYPQSGNAPQELLNQQFVRACDAAIAIFWTRFGTPTDQYASGSEEEIETMLKGKKQVFMYFSDKPITPSIIDKNQYQKVIEFKNKYKELGLFSSYSSDAEFEKLLFAHLSQHFLTLPKKDESKPSLSLKSIHNGQLYNTAHVEKFKNSNKKNSRKILNDISALFWAIYKNKLSPYNKKSIFNSKKGTFQFNKPVEIEKATIALIKTFAKNKDIKITKDFFNLGNLKESHLETTSMIGSKQNLVGNASEKKKYADIIKLEKLINEILNLISLEKCFENLHGINFVLSNNGTTYDEDIDIELDFKADMLLFHRNLPIPFGNLLKYACDEYSFLDLFGIKATANYMDYDSSKKSPNFPVSYSEQTTLDLFEERNYEEDYKDNLDEIFEYQYYKRDESSIVKLHVDYIKQHTTVAFPTPIFVTDKRYDIKYKITSKHNPEVLSGIIKIEK